MASDVYGGPRKHSAGTAMRENKMLKICPRKNVQRMEGRRTSKRRRLVTGRVRQRLEAEMDVVRGKTWEEARKAG